MGDSNAGRFAGARNPRLLRHFVTNSEEGLKGWHLFLRHVTFGAALCLMVASFFAVRWACLLVGLPSPFEDGGQWTLPFAEAVPLAMEVAMAATASAATTIRKQPRADHPNRPGGYYISLWVIFGFLMALAQVANIGHAIVAITEQLAGMALPTWIPDQAVYIFGGAFAALFPLGGTMFVHVSGFVRAHGVGADWIESNAQEVYLEAGPAPRATAAGPARQTSKPATPTAAASRPSAAPRAARTARARELFDEHVSRDPKRQPQASGRDSIHATLVTEFGQAAPHGATVRTWCKDWRAEHTAEPPGQPLALAR
jgi:hypothetical protein